MTLDFEPEQPRRRASNLAVVTARSAKQLAAPFQKQIEPWQARLAHLRAMALLRPREDVRAAAAELVPLVVAARIELEGAVEKLGDKAVAHHSAVSSVRAALVRLRDELESL